MTKEYLALSLEMDDGSIRYTYFTEDGIPKYTFGNGDAKYDPASLQENLDIDRDLGCVIIEGLGSSGGYLKFNRLRMNLSAEGDSAIRKQLMIWELLK